MSLRKIIFLDRDGTLLREPKDRQVDSIEKFSLVPGVIPALLSLKEAGYGFVMVTNQDGLGSKGYPRARFKLVQGLLLGILASSGIELEEILICPHLERERCPCRKPGLGLLRGYMADPDWDRPRSYVIGDRGTDMELARNMGIPGLRLSRWEPVARSILSAPRSAKLRRQTRETSVEVEVDLDGSGRSRLSTGIGFFDHMLEQLAKHGSFDLRVEVKGDLRVDEHHTVEDTGLAIGAALRRALGDKRGIGRYGFVLPMDEARTKVALDLSGRPFFKFKGEIRREFVGGMAMEMVPHFFRSLSESLGACLHLELEGENAHHMVESAFKGVGRSLRLALARTGGGCVPSTKGTL